MTTHKYNIGDNVIYTNEFGVCFGVKTITEQGTDAHGLPGYKYDGSSPAWWFTNESRFALATDKDLKFTPEQLQKRYGFNATRAQRAALLDVEY